MKFDTEAFVGNIGKLNDKEPLELVGNGMKYLYDLFLTYTLEDKYMFVDDVKFDRFTEDDLRQFCELYDNQIMGDINQADKILRLFYNTKPKSSQNAAMFF